MDQVAFAVESRNGRMVRSRLTAAQIQECKRTSKQPATEYPYFGRDDVIPILIYLGFDAYAATSFARSTSSITNFYIKCANHAYQPFRFLLYSAIVSGVPYHFVMESFWSEMDVLKDGIDTLITTLDNNNKFVFQKKRMIFNVVGIVCDMENMDPLTQCIRATKDSRTQGVFYRGAHDPLAPDAEFYTLDARYIKEYEWWLRINALVRNAGFTQAVWRRMIRAEGLSGHAYSHRWLPATQVPFNVLLQGIADVCHDFDALFSKMRERILKSLKKGRVKLEKQSMRWLAAWAQQNKSETLPCDPLALRKTAQSDFRQNYRRTFLFWLALSRFEQQHSMIGTLRIGLDTYVSCFQCFTPNDVFEFQSKVRLFLQMVEKHFPTGIKPNLHIPKARDLIKLAFVTIPLYHSVVTTQNLQMESAHRLWKKRLANHSNYHGDFVKHSQRRIRELVSYEYIWNGGRCGPLMTYEMDEQMREVCDPCDITKPLFEPVEVLGFGLMMQPRLRFDSKNALKLDMTEFKKDACFASVVQFAKEMHFINTEGELLENCLVYDVFSGLIYDHQNSDYINFEREPALWCGTCELASTKYTPFVCKSQRCLKIINLKKANKKAGELICIEEDTEAVLMAVFGELFIVSYPSDGDSKIKKVCNKGPLHYHYKLGKRVNTLERAVHGLGDDQMGGDNLGAHWIPGCCVISTAVIAHMCRDVLTGQSCHMAHGRWTCDLQGWPYMDVFTPQWLWCPALHRPQRCQRCIPNHRRFFNLQSLV